MLPRMVRGDPGFRVDLKDPSAALNLTAPGLAPASFSPLDDYFYFDGAPPADRRRAARLPHDATPAALPRRAHCAALPRRLPCNLTHPHVW